MAIIRPCTPADQEALRDLVLELHEGLRPLDEDLAPGREIIAEYFGGLLAAVERTDGAIFVAELYVRPADRDRGLGRRLAARAEAFAKERGSYKMELKVLAGNEAAIRFYAALGYRARVVVMSKRLLPPGTGV
jgi:ribosomal protein S18 acetylase RimI-like enzyme